MAGADESPLGADGEGAPCEEDAASGLLLRKPANARRRRFEIRRAKAGGINFSLGTETPDDGSNSSSPSDHEADEGFVGILAAGGEIPGREVHAALLPCLSHGAVSLIGRRREMEDAVSVEPAFAGGGGFLVYDFFGVYDGHGGSRVAQACRDRLHIVLAEEVAAWGWPGAEGRWREVMAASFSRVDGEVEAAAQAESERTVGSTAVVAVVGTKRIVVANCGDSRAVLCRGGAAVPLSFDHKFFRR